MAITNIDDQLSGVIVLKKYQLSCFYLPSATLKYALSRSAANIISLNTNVISFFYITIVHKRVMVSLKEYILVEHRTVVIDINIIMDFEERK